MKNNKAQVTAFILVGIVLMIIFGALFLVVDKFVLEKENIAVTPKSFVQDCAKIATRQALEILGRHEAIPNKLNPLDLAKPADTKYCTSLSTSKEKLTLPPLSSTIEKLEPIINLKLKECVGDFEILKKQGYNLEVLDEPESTVTFSPDQIIVEAIYEVEFRAGDKVEPIDEVLVSMPSNYKKLHAGIKWASEPYINSKEIPAEAFNKIDQTFLMTPNNKGLMTIALDEKASMYQPVNYTFPFY